MFNNVLIFFSVLFFFFLNSFELKSLTKTEILSIKKKLVITNSIISKSRSEKSKFNKKEYKESKLVLEAIKKKNWVNANKLSKNDPVLKKIVEWHFLKENNNSKFYLRTSNFIKKNPEWPQNKLFRKKIELFIDKNLNNKKIIEFFSQNPPLTTKGAVNYIDALKKKMV